MTHLAILCLGGFGVTLDGEPVVDFAYDKVRALLAYLAVERDRPQRRDHLAGLLWPDYTDASARTNLRNALACLRRALGDRDADDGTASFLLATRETIRLNPAADWSVDVAVFERLMDGGTASGAVDGLTSALDLYRGPFLADFALPDSAPFEDWLVAVREHAHRQAVEGYRRLARVYEAAGDLARTCDVARQLVELAPWLEEGHRMLMRALVLSGQRGAALAQYERCRRALQAELDASPSAVTQALVEQIRAGELQAGGLQPASDCVTLGGALSFLDPDRPAELPATDADLVDDMRFVARERELERLGAYLAQALNGKGRLIFITGEAGQGKTALVQAFVSQAQAMLPALIVADGRCNAYTGVGDPYLPFREILGQLTGDVAARWAAGALDRERARRLWHVLPVAIQTLLGAGPDLIGTFLPGEPLAQRASCWAVRTSSQEVASQEVASREVAWLRRLYDLFKARAAHGSEPVPRQDDLFAQMTTVLQQIARDRPLLLFIDDIAIFYALAVRSYACAEFGKAQEVGERLLDIAEQLQESAVLVLAYEFWGQLRCHLGDFDPGLAYLKRAVDLYDPQAHRMLAFQAGVDPGAAGLIWCAMYAWIAGYPDQGVEFQRRSLALAESLDHPYSLCIVLVLGAWFYVQMRDAGAARELDDRCIRLSVAQGFALYTNGSNARGWILAQEGQLEEGIRLFREDMAVDDAMGFTAYRAHRLWVLADLCLLAGRLQEGIAAADAGIANAARSDSCFVEADTRRLKGELLLAQGDADAAEVCFRQALALARQQAARAWELRAAMGLARLWQRQDRFDDAYDLLRGVYGWFTEGFDTPDLRDARTLLAALEPGPS